MNDTHKKGGESMDEYVDNGCGTIIAVFTAAIALFVGLVKALLSWSSNRE